MTTWTVVARPTGAIESIPDLGGSYADYTVVGDPGALGDQSDLTYAERPLGSTPRVLAVPWTELPEDALSRTVIAASLTVRFACLAGSGPMSGTHFFEFGDGRWGEGDGYGQTQIDFSGLEVGTTVEVTRVLDGAGDTITATQMKSVLHTETPWCMDYWFPSGGQYRVFDMWVTMELTGYPPGEEPTVDPASRVDQRGRRVRWME